MTTTLTDPTDLFTPLFDAEHDASVVRYWAKSNLPGPVQVPRLTKALHALLAQRHTPVNTAAERVACLDERRAALHSDRRAATIVLLNEESLSRLPFTYGVDIAAAQLDTLIAATPRHGDHGVDSWLGATIAIHVLTAESGQPYLPNDFISIAFPSAAGRRNIVYSEEDFGPHGAVVPHYNDEPAAVRAAEQTFAELLEDSLNVPDTRDFLVSLRDRLR